MKALISYLNLLITLIGLSISQDLSGQENFIKGYIIQDNKDTLTGFIDYRNWGENPNKINFRKSEKQKGYTTYTADEIVAFGIEDEEYVSAVVKFEFSQRFSNNIREESPETNIEIDTIFLQTLVKGEKSLYCYKKTNGNTNFYIENEDNYDLLIYKKYLRRDMGATHIGENKQFIRQLSKYLYSCDDIQEQVSRITYTQNELIKLFKHYYGCLNSKPIFEKKSEKLNTDFGLLAGFSSTSFRLKGERYPHLVLAGYKPSSSYTFGVFFDLIFPRNQRKWSLHSELQYSAFKVNGNYGVFTDENSYTTSTTNFAFSYIKLNNLLRYKYPVGKYFIYFQGGISNGLILQSTNQRIKTTKFYSSLRVVESIALEKYRNHEESYVLGIGVGTKRVSLETRYERGNGMSIYEDLNSITKRYYVLASWKF